MDREHGTTAVRLPASVPADEIIKALSGAASFSLNDMVLALWRLHEREAGHVSGVPTVHGLVTSLAVGIAPLLKGEPSHYQLVFDQTMRTSEYCHVFIVRLVASILGSPKSPTFGSPERLKASAPALAPETLARRAVPRRRCAGHFLGLSGCDAVLGPEKRQRHIIGRRHVDPRSLLVPPRSLVATCYPHQQQPKVCSLVLNSRPDKIPGP